MKPVSKLWVVGLLLTTLSGCGDNGALVAEGVQPGTYRIGSFNLRNFGPSRIDNTAVMLTLVHTLKRYDLALLMEIRDASGAAPLELLAGLNAVSDAPYAMVLSERLGRSDYKEQYALIYKTDVVTVLDYYTYDDGVEPYQDQFEREPLVAYVDMAGVRFNVIGLHADPDGVLYELNRLLPVYEDTVVATGDQDAILMGDFNADCGYLPRDEFDYVLLRNDPSFVWLIDDEADTTTTATNCALDRIVITRDFLESQLINAEAGIYDFKTDFGLSDELAFDVSNHYPVEMSFTVGGE